MNILDISIKVIIFNLLLRAVLIGINIQLNTPIPQLCSLRAHTTKYLRNQISLSQGSLE